MKWTKITIETTVDAEDIVISSLYDLGLTGVQIEDNVPLSAAELKGMFVDVPPEPPAGDNVAYLHFYVDGAPTIAAIENVLRDLAATRDIGPGRVTLSEIDDDDFRDNWKAHFHQFAIGDVLIVPSWETPENPAAYRYLLHIDPGAAFGTGAHETTRMCIRQLREQIRGGERVLDVGCGSGILGIMALMFGAKEVTATDLDPLVLEAVRANCEANGITTAQLTVHLGDLISDEECRRRVGRGYGLATANIVAHVLVPLAPAVHACLNQGGLFIASGILADKEAQVTEALINSGFAVRETLREGEWVNIMAVKI